MPVTVYRVQRGARIYRTRSAYEATQASRAGARVTARTEDGEGV